METPKQETPPTQQPSVRFFRKELISNRLSLPNGKSVKFEQVGDTDSGIIGTSDLALAAELDKAAAAGVGGVVAITEEQFNELKKNPPAGRSRIRSLDAQSVRQLLNQRAVNAPVAEVKHEPSEPMKVEKGLATISSRRKLKEMTEQAAKTQAAA